MANADFIFIEGLKVRGMHGVSHPERHSFEQEFEVSAKMYMETHIAAKSENLSDALDYVPIRDKIVGIIQTNTFYLIERLADTLCAEILKDTRITKVELTIRKTAIWDNGVPGVTVVREQ